MNKTTSSLLLIAGLTLACQASHATPQADGHLRLAAARLATNYAGRLDHRLSWRTFPIKVYFVRDANYTEEREDRALDGFDRWTTATNGFIQYDVTLNPKLADIRVKFNPGTNNGLTTSKFRKDRIMSADIMIGVMLGGAKDIEFTAAHEFGHALGIDGHSDDERDLMYATHFMGSPVRLTERDLNTLAQVYPMFGRRTVALRGPAPSRIIRGPSAG